jgi:hypothetical protein
VIEFPKKHSKLISNISVGAGRADFIVTLNPKDFPQTLLSAHVIKPGKDVPTTARRKPRLRV